MDTTGSQFFPAVRLIRGACASEHGDTMQALVAVDDAGIVYVLGSPSSFNFLLRRHPLSGLDSTNVVEYVRQALSMMGEMVDDPRTVLSPQEIPGDIRPRPIASVLEAPLSRVVGVQDGRFTVSLWILSTGRLSQYVATVNLQGHLTMGRTDLWKAERVH
jgi:hypothetical protein